MKNIIFFFVFLFVLTFNGANADCSYVIVDGVYTAVDVCTSTTISGLGSSSAMYSCSDDGKTLMQMSYANADCSGNASATVNVTDTDSFNCGGDNCYVLAQLSGYLTANCNGSAYVVTQIAYVTGMCNMEDSNSYFKIQCTDDSLTTANYTDSSCSTEDMSMKFDGSCQSDARFGFTSYMFDVQECTSSNGAASFSTLISLALVSIAFFAH